MDTNNKNFSLFKAPISNKIPCKNCNMLEVYNYIVSDKAKHHTNVLRSITDKKEARKYKGTNFCYCTFSGIFNEHKDSALVEHSNYLCIDLDHVDIKDTKKKLLSDEYFETELLFVSPSGDGLKWVIEIDTEKASHEDWYEAVSNYLHHTYSLTVDTQCSNVSRACFLCHDSNCIINKKYLKI